MYELLLQELQIELEAQEIESLDQAAQPFDSEELEGLEE